MQTRVLRLKATFLVIAFLLSLTSQIEAKEREFIITFGGDVNFNRSGQVPLATGVKRHGTFHSWANLSQHIDHLFDGHLNFINLETVLTDRTNLKPANKRFVFQSHPNAMEHFRDLGVNLISTANNHAYDYGYAGYEDTRKHLERLSEKPGPLHPLAINPKLFHHGIDKKAALFKPKVFAVEDVVIAFNAMTFQEVAYPATNSRAGVLDANNLEHWDKVIAGFAKSKADLKILSLHKGRERDIEVPKFMVQRLRKAVQQGDLNLVLAHHPHVARGVEKVDSDSVIFYGLGNFLMLGARDMGPLEDAKDFGLFGRLVFRRTKTGRWLASMAQAVPLTDMHLYAKPMGYNAARRRLNHLNRLSQRTSGNRAVRFDIKPNATGIACFEPTPGFYANNFCGSNFPNRPKPKPTDKTKKKPTKTPTRVLRAKSL